MYSSASISALLVFVFLCVAPLRAASAQNNDISVTEIKQAVQQYQCFRETWGSPKEGGKVLRLTFHSRGNTAFAQAIGLESPPELRRMVTFLTIVARDGRSVVTEVEGFDPSLAHTPEFQRNERKTETQPSRTVYVQLLLTCTVPAFADALKDEIIQRIERSVSQEVRGFNNRLGNKGPAWLKIVIGQFDINYPETNVLIPSDGEVLRVRLDTHAIPGDHSGLYPIQPVMNSPEAKTLTEKILEHGIVREIGLTE